MGYEYCEVILVEAVMFHWHYLRRDPKARRRDPVQSELFHDDDLRKVAQAVVRESIQNSLDARADLSSLVRVRIYCSGADGALSPEKANVYFSTLIPHLIGAYPKAQSDLTGMMRLPCQFLVIEDFGTTGLTGDPTRLNRPPEGVADNFFYFFRAEGASGKGGGKRGRWGIGKHTFFASSHIQTFIGLTICDQPDKRGPFVMGQSISKVHSDPTNPQHELEPDGWMAIDDPKVWLPYEDSVRIRQISADWKLRRTNEPGLTVVVPYCDEGISSEDLVVSVLFEYSAPILQGILEVEIETGSCEPVLLSSKTIINVLENFIGERPDLVGLQNLVRRMAKLITFDSKIAIVLTEVDNNPTWSRELLTEELRGQFNEQLDSHGFAVIRVPVSITTKLPSQKKQDSYFDVGFFSQPEASRAVFIREGIRISSVGSKTTPFTGLQPIVLIPTGVLGSLLGDAEGPAHLNWDPRRETFIGNYEHGPAWIEFVRLAPRRLIEFTRGLDKEPDFGIGSGWFPEPDDLKKKKGKSKTKLVRPQPPPVVPLVVLTKVNGGFSAHVNHEHPDAGTVKFVRLLMAYDRRSGNPFSRWNSADFIVSDLEIKKIGCEVYEENTNRKGNRITFKINSKNFKVTIKGFDMNRDVIARAEHA